MRKQVQRDKTIYPRRQKQNLDVEFPPAPGQILSVLHCTGSRAPVLCLNQAGGLQCSLLPLKLQVMNISQGREGKAYRLPVCQILAKFRDLSGASLFSPIKCSQYDLLPPAEEILFKKTQ